VVGVTWWGHATCTIEDSGIRILTDPVLTARLGHLRRRRGPGPGPDARRADLVLVSHLHADHLHLASLAALAPQIPIVVPRGAVGAVPALRRLRGREFVEVAPDDVVRVGPVAVRAVPAAHDGRRWPGGRRSAPALGYVVTGQGRTYFAGDTDVYPQLPDAVGRCDVALLPVGGWGPVLGPGHLDPARAAGLLPLLAVRHAIPIHFGTLWPIGMDRVRPHEFLPPGREFARHAARIDPGCEIHELRPAGSVHIDCRAP
jgi:L-ascorbate metabolism protein UlaG (beta-lactamase superfamily)